MNCDSERRFRDFVQRGMRLHKLPDLCGFVPHLALTGDGGTEVGAACYLAGGSRLGMEMQT